MRTNRRYDRAFTLVELLVVMSIIAMLLAVILPALGMARSQAKKAVCASNLDQLGLAFSMYLNDYNRRVFPLAQMGRDNTGQLGIFWYFGFEPGTSFSLPEGRRLLFREYAKLYPYIRQYDSVEICPAFPYGSSKYKPKYNTKWMTYGINSRLSIDLREPGRKVIDFDKYTGGVSNILVFTDSSQVNAFQSPASPSNPMFEEWHYVEPLGGLFVHFRHNLKANVLFGDGHVSKAPAEKDSFDIRLPGLNIGRFGKEIPF